MSITVKNILKRCSFNKPSILIVLHNSNSKKHPAIMLSTKDNFNFVSKVKSKAKRLRIQKGTSVFNEGGTQTLSIKISSTFLPKTDILNLCTAIEKHYHPNL